MINKTTTKQTWLKLLLAFIVGLLIVAFALPLAACSNADGDDVEKLGPIPEGSTRVTINYYRLNGDYDDWNMWMWTAGKDGSAYPFKAKTVTLEGEKWATLTVDIPGVDLSESNAIGFIVRKGAWTSRDPGTGDRFIPAEKIVDNKVTIYLAQGRWGIYYDAKSAYDAATSNTITSAQFTNFKSLTLTTSSNITASSYFKIYDESDNLVSELNCAETTKYNNKTTAIIKFSEEIDLAKSYRITDEPVNGFDKAVNFVGCDITMASLYETSAFTKKYIYDGELGVDYSVEKSTFRVWSPVASELKLNIYSAGEGGTATTTAMTKGEKGVWEVTLNGDQNGKYYTYTVTARGTTKEVVDPYARSAGRDGKRGMILDLATTDPEGWEEQDMPELASYSRAVIYEAQLRDLTINPNSGVSEKNRGKFLGLTETGTTVTVGDVTKSTGLDYLKELGVTTVHFQPLFDFASVKEDFNQATYNKNGEYNWGYDPLNYNIPEGSYSTNPADGKVRVNEMKQMVMALHNAGIQVVMDVVYNHVSDAQGSNFEALMPGYYFRTTDSGAFYDGSGCGNETASERAMFRKFMIESVLYWTEEYKIDGFRFDLMGLHDIETMNQLYDALAEVNADVIVYGEGWTGGTSGLDSEEAAIQDNASKMPNIAVFNDIIRDGLKGSVFTMTETGFVSGHSGLDASVYVGAAGATDALGKTLYDSMGKKPFALNPTQSVNYVSAHDNSTLFDKLNASVKDADLIKSMYSLAAVSTLTSQGPAFFLAGEEMMRSKPTEAENEYDNRPSQYLTNPNYYFSDNSYKSPDSVNAIDWTKRIENDEMIEFYKNLIQIKRNTPFFQFETTEELKNALVFIDTDTDDGVAVYGIKYEDIFVIIALNANDSDAEIAIPVAEFQTVLNGMEINAEGLEGQQVTDGKLTVGAYSASVVYAAADGIDTAKWLYDVDVK